MVSTTIISTSVHRDGIIIKPATFDVVIFSYSIINLYIRSFDVVIFSYSNKFRARLAKSTLKFHKIFLITITVCYRFRDQVLLNYVHRCIVSVLCWSLPT